jgi:hypothetical protein
MNQEEVGIFPKEEIWQAMSKACRTNGKECNCIDIQDFCPIKNIIKGTFRKDEYVHGTTCDVYEILSYFLKARINIHLIKGFLSNLLPNLEISNTLKL